MNGIERITKERQRQINEENFTAEYDDNFHAGELAILASAYALSGKLRTALFPKNVCMGFNILKPSPDNRIRELEKAGALIAAEIDRLLRLEDI